MPTQLMCLLRQKRQPMTPMARPRMVKQTTTAIMIPVGKLLAVLEPPALLPLKAAGVADGVKSGDEMVGRGILAMVTSVVAWGTT